MAYIGTSPSNGVRRKHTYTATASQTSFSGAGAEGATLSYNDSNFVDVYQNGVKLSEADYTSTSGTAIVLAQGASVSDIVEVVVYDVFSVADTVSKADGGTFDNAVTIITTDNTAQLTLKSTDADSSTGPVLDLTRDSASPADGDSVGEIVFKADDDGGNSTEFASIQTKIADASDGAESGKIEIAMNVAGTSRKMINIKSNEVAINDGSIDVDFRVESTTKTNMLFVDAGNDRIGINQSTPLQPLHLTDADFAFARFETTAVSKTGMDVGQHQDGTGHINLRDANHIKISTADTERVRIKDDGNILIGTTSTTPNPGLVALASGQFGIGKNNSNSGGSFIEFRRNATQIGGVTQNGTTGVTYGTSSDYRLKENVTTSWDATTRLKQLKPSRFNFIAEPDRTVDGFLAHEVSSIVPEAITGDKDAMTEEVLYVDGDEIPDGKKIGDVKEASKIDPQGIDQSKLVPLLTKALQEAMTRIETLEADVKALKGE